MKQIKDIFAGVKTESILGSDILYISELVFDSRKVRKDDVFFAIAGTQSDGHQYIKKAVELGAAAVVWQTGHKETVELTQNQTYKNITFIEVSDTSKALAQAAARFYGYPSRQLRLIGITGTNGKTTTATLLHRLFLSLDIKAGLISTVKNYINTDSEDTKFTTPDALTFNKLLRKMADAGCEYCFAEVSSHAIAQNRIEGLEFAGGVFTNLTHDHLDYHKTFSDYLKTKKTFFDNLPAQAFALTNIDDKNGNVMLQNTKAKKYTYGVRTFADYKIKVQETHFDGMLSEINGTEFWSILIGDFNAYNLVAVYAVANLSGIEKQEILRVLSSLSPVKGRFEIINKNGKTAIVDYAHTPDALKNVISTINKIKKNEQNLISVVGAGGDRDTSKRPLMARVAAQGSERLILTSDNPRSENPDAILNDMEAGLSDTEKMKMLKITNREEGIKTALMLAQKGDIVLIAGKGHEDYQEINGTRHHFDDREIAEKYI